MKLSKDAYRLLNIYNEISECKSQLSDYELVQHRLDTILLQYAKDLNQILDTNSGLKNLSILRGIYDC